ncbi:cytochrome d ubiquinol oxidase subunit II [Amycolatopsis taiwanensis]|uniref:Cytochrome bd oxidase subunit II n=1 Tax=Amycolatopsis taiwanensis TaxID=342230 RepID=A0A9W6R7U4_9PSEU|nr:cytochrome d ubiquinol oxidase subunit II [Amycolatopsis taiwanensis]GLY69870.1 cytochrome bd oxidase subunit II [Amycolatopsis taiwanensis]
MEILWSGALGLLLTGYFALAGYDYGVGMLASRLGRDEAGRRRVLGALGPFFLGNEVWLVAAVGVLFGAFPHLEGTVLAGGYLLVVTLLLGLVAFTAAVQLRSRRPDARRGGWDALITGGALVTTVSWGMLIGNLVQGFPLDASGKPDGELTSLLSPYALLFGAGFVALLALHGAVFLTVRGDDTVRKPARRIALALVPPSVLFVLIATGWAAVAGVPGSTGVTPLIGFGGALLAVATLLGVRLALRAGRFRVALAATMLTAALPVLVAGSLRLPTVLVSTSEDYRLALDTAAAPPSTLALLTTIGGPAILLVIVVQWLTWRANRHPVGPRTLLHF